MSSISRRDFLKLASSAILTASGLLGMGGLLRFLDTQTDAVPPTDFDLGPAANYAIGDRSLRPEIPAFIFRTTSGFTAMSLVCTHLGCTVESKPDGFVCPCHGSKFDMQGKVTRGPAQKSLNSLQTRITPDGNLHVYTN